MRWQAVRDACMTQGFSHAVLWFGILSWTVRSSSMEAATLSFSLQKRIAFKSLARQRTMLNSLFRVSPRMASSARHMHDTSVFLLWPSDSMLYLQHQDGQAWKPRGMIFPYKNNGFTRPGPANDATTIVPHWRVIKVRSWGATRRENHRMRRPARHNACQWEVAALPSSLLFTSFFFLCVSSYGGPFTYERASL